MGENSQVITINGVVKECLSNSQFRILLENNLEIIARLSGKIQMHKIRIINGDKVIVEISPYDLTKGRITYRIRGNEKKHEGSGVS